MVLNQYAYFIRKKDAIDDFTFKRKKYKKVDFYWRKNRHLHGWMEQLYKDKGGTGIFDCEAIRLKEKDLKKLREAIKNRSFDDVYVFFWGDTEYSDDDAERDLDFVNQAEDWIVNQDGAVYYTSWW